VAVGEDQQVLLTALEGTVLRARDGGPAADRSAGVVRAAAVPGADLLDGGAERRRAAGDQGTLGLVLEAQESVAARAAVVEIGRDAEIRGRAAVDIVGSETLQVVGLVIRRPVEGDDVADAEGARGPSPAAGVRAVGREAEVVAGGVGIVVGRGAGVGCPAIAGVVRA